MAVLHPGESVAVAVVKFSEFALIWREVRPSQIRIAGGIRDGVKRGNPSGAQRVSRGNSGLLFHRSGRGLGILACCDDSNGGQAAQNSYREPMPMNVTSYGEPPRTTLLLKFSE